MKPRFGEPCDCLSHDVKARDQKQKRQHTKTLRAFSKAHYENRPKSVDQWQDMFSRIFAAKLHHLSLINIAFHLLEEMGKVSDAIVRMYTYSEKNFVLGEPSWRQIWLEDALADVLSWLFMMVEKIDIIRRTANKSDRWLFEIGFSCNHITLSKIIWERYGSDDLKDFICPHTQDRQRICVCPLIIVSADRSVKDVRKRVVNVLGLKTEMRESSLSRSVDG